MLSRDGWGGLAVLAASLLLFGLTLGLPANPMVPIGPGFYPRIVLGLTALLGCWLLISDLKSKPKDAGLAEKLNYAAVAIHFAVFAVYVAAMPYLGFRVATAAYVAAANALLEPPHGARGWLRVAAIALLSTLATYVIFERYLLVLLPRGHWTGW